MFSENLRTVRKSHGYRQSDLAVRLGFSQQTVAKWENGKSEPSIKTLIKLSKIFECSVDELLKED